MSRKIRSIKRLKIKIFFPLAYIFMLIFWMWGSVLVQKVIIFFAGNNIENTENLSNIMVGINFIFFAVSLILFSIIFYKLIDKNEELKEQTEKERIMLFANIAHDLKTPISSVLGYSQALSDGVVVDEAKQKEYLRTINTKARRMNDLIDRLFEYVKLESPENILHKKDSDIAEILRKSVRNLYTDFEEKGFELNINIPDIPVIQNVDALEIDRVFTNLLNNALKHNPKGTVIDISINENAAVIIADNGTEIPVEVRSQLFKPFVSGDESRTAKNGSGLGLALAYKIMEKHGGSLKLVTPYEAGNTVFTKAFIIQF